MGYVLHYFLSDPRLLKIPHHRARVYWWGMRYAGMLACGTVWWIYAERSLCEGAILNLLLVIRIDEFLAEDELLPVEDFQPIGDTGSSRYFCTVDWSESYSNTRDVKWPHTHISYCDQNQIPRLGICTPSGSGMNSDGQLLGYDASEGIYRQAYDWDCCPCILPGGKIVDGAGVHRMETLFRLTLPHLLLSVFVKVQGRIVCLRQTALTDSNSV